MLDDLLVSMQMAPSFISLQIVEVWTKALCSGPSALPAALWPEGSWVQFEPGNYCKAFHEVQLDWEDAFPGLCLSLHQACQERRAGGPLWTIHGTQEESCFLMGLFGTFLGLGLL